MAGLFQCGPAGFYNVTSFRLVLNIYKLIKTKKLIQCPFTFKLYITVEFQMSSDEVEDDSKEIFFMILGESEEAAKDRDYQNELENIAAEKEEQIEKNENVVAVRSAIDKPYIPFTMHLVHKKMQSYIVMSILNPV